MADRLSPGVSGQSPASSSGQPRIRRRNRIITSCLECRRRKLKCDRSHPCNHCLKAKRDCVFLAPSMDANSKNKLNQFKESVESLEKDLGRSDENGIFGDWNIATTSTQEYAGQLYAPPPSRGIVRPKDDDQPADEKGLEPTPLAVADIIYDDDNDDLIDDLGVKLGKMRITERIGGFVRPRFADELAMSVQMNPDIKLPSYVTESLEESPFSPGSDDSQSWLEPSDDYIAPGLGLAFPLGSQPEEVSLLTFLPSKDFADKLLERYWTAVDPIVKAVHRPSFERQYTQFWNEVSAGFEPSTNLQALIFAMKFSASVSLLEEQAHSTFGCPRNDMVRTFRMGCEYALSKSNLLRTTRTTTIQAFIMYLIPLCRAEVSRAHASLVSMAIRLAECAGFHRDGSNYSLSAVEIHVRRLLWYQLCFLDVRTCEAVGPRPSIRVEDFDVKMPLNVDDLELESLVPPTEDAARFTENTLTRLRIESTELTRVIWRERPRVETGETTLTALLRVIEAHKQRMITKYLPLLDHKQPLQAFAALFIQFMIARSSIGVLHRYVVSTATTPPERLTRIVWANGARQLDACLEWDTSPVFRPLFSWYLGAWQQWHVCLLFIPLIITMKEPQPELQRVWRALDYVFELDPLLSGSEKMQLAFGVARKRLEEMQKQRKARLPVTLEQRLGRPVKSAPASDRRTSVIYQMPKQQTQYSTMSDYNSQRASQGPDSTDSFLQSMQPQTEARERSSSYSSNHAYQENIGSYYQTGQEAAATNSMSFNNMSSSNDPSQFGGVNWMEDFESLFPLDENDMLKPQFYADAGTNVSASMSNDSAIPPMTLLPGGPWLPTQSNQQSQQQSKTQPGQQWGY